MMFSLLQIFAHFCEIRSIVSFAKELLTCSNLRFFTNDLYNCDVFKANKVEERKLIGFWSLCV